MLGLRPYSFGNPAAMGAAAFSPASITALVDSWEGGLAYWWQDSAGTTPVTADGDPIGRWVGRYNAKVLTAAGTARPTARFSGGLWHAEFDGTTDVMAVANALVPSPFSIYVRAILTATTGPFCSHNSGGNDGYRLYQGNPLLLTYGGVAAYSITGASEPVAGTRSTASVRVTGGTATGAYDATSGSVAVGAIGGTPTQFQVGGGIQGPEFNSCKIAAILWAGSSPGTTDHNSLLTYLGLL